MNHRGRAYHRPHFRVLSDFQTERLYQATLACLERTGVNVLNDEARRLLGDAGADVHGVRVRVPQGLIEEVLEAAPRSFELWERPRGGDCGVSGEAVLEVCATELDSSDPDCVHFGPGLTSSYFLDPETGERRRSLRGDPKSTALVCDALDNRDYVMGLGLIDDVEPDLAPVYEFAEMVVATGKPMIPWAYSLQNMLDMYEIALVVAGDEESLRQRPFFALFATSQAPLQHANEDLATVLWAPGKGIPVVYLGGGSAGTTAPIIGAGALVISLASGCTNELSRDTTGVSPPRRLTLVAESVPLATEVHGSGFDHLSCSV